MRETKTFTLYKFHELPSEGKATAIQAEREAYLPVIQEMILALFERELHKAGAVLTNLEIDWETNTVMADINANHENVDVVERIAEETTETAQKELPTLLGDAYMQANIEADDLEFLVTGKVWIYRDEEGTLGHIGKGGIQVNTGKDGKAMISILPLEPMNVLDAESFMCEFIDAVTRAREIDGDPLPE